MKDHPSCYIRPYHWKCKASTKLILWSMALTLHLAMGNLFSEEILGRSPVPATDELREVFCLKQELTESWSYYLNPLHLLLRPLRYVFETPGYICHSQNLEKRLKAQRQESSWVSQGRLHGRNECDTFQMTSYAYFQLYIVCSFEKMPLDIFVNLLFHILS